MQGPLGQRRSTTQNPQVVARRVTDHGVLVVFAHFENPVVAESPTEIERELGRHVGIGDDGAGRRAYQRSAERALVTFVDDQELSLGRQLVLRSGSNTAGL